MCVHQMKIVKGYLFSKTFKNMYMGTTIYFSLLGGYKINQFYFLPNYYISLFLAESLLMLYYHA